MLLPEDMKHYKLIDIVEWSAIKDNLQAPGDFYFLLTSLIAQSYEINRIIDGTHPLYACKDQAAKQWLSHVLRQSITDLTPFTLSIIKALHDSFLVEVNTSPIIQKAKQDPCIPYVLSLLEQAGITPAEGVTGTEETLIELFKNLEDSTRRYHATFSSGWLGEFDVGGELVITS